MAKYFTINRTPHTFDEVKPENYFGTWINEHDRGLDGECEYDGQHEWLLLPHEEGQKHYLMCIRCHLNSHL
jgi:hypothetical protein